MSATAVQPGAARRALEDDEWTYPFHKTHQFYISECMSLHHWQIDDPYPRDKQFTKEELQTLTPSAVRRHLCYKAYLDPYPNLEKNHPTDARAESLRKVKQGMSFFMPDKHVPWIDGRGGNPTRHHSINVMINKVQDMETKGLGVDPNDKRGCTDIELMKALDLLHRNQDWDICKKCYMMSLWANHLIHRMDDASHFQCNAPHGCVKFPFTLKTKKRWSKNVRQMSQCSDQIILTDDDWKTCTIYWLSQNLEGWLGMHPNVKFMFTTDPRDKEGPFNLKKTCHNNLEKWVWKDPDFVALFDEMGEDAEKGLGAHSVRKRASNAADKAGADLEQTEHRGRWAGQKGQKVVGRVHVQKCDNYVDAFVASLLCEGGPIKYELAEGALLTDHLLFDNCCPNIAVRYQHDKMMCRVLGLASLWGAWDEGASSIMDATKRDHIQTSYVRDHGAMPGNGNPVRKIKLTIVRNNRRLDVLEQAGQRGEATTTAPSAGAAAPAQRPQTGQVTNEQLLAMLQQMERTNSSNFGSVKAAQVADRAWAREQFKKVNTNQRAWAGTIGPALGRHHAGRQQRQREHNNAAAQQQQQQQQQQASEEPRRNTTTVATPIATTTRCPDRVVHPTTNLIDNPTSLYQFHEEWVHGIGTNKPMRLFTTDERNRTKGFAMKFGRWCLLCKTIECLINQQFTLNAAIERIIDVYGSSAPGHIITAMKAEQKLQHLQFVGDIRMNPRIRLGGDTAAGGAAAALAQMGIVNNNNNNNNNNHARGRGGGFIL